MPLHLKSVFMPITLLFFILSESNFLSLVLYIWKETFVPLLLEKIVKYIIT